MIFVLNMGFIVLVYGQTPQIEVSIENTGNNHIKVNMEVIDPNGDMDVNWNSAKLVLRIPLMGIEPGIPRTDGSGFAPDPDITNFMTGFPGAPLMDAFGFNIATYTPSDQNLMDDGYMYIILTSAAASATVMDGDTYCLAEFDLPPSWQCDNCVEIATGSAAGKFFTPANFDPLVLNAKGFPTVIVNGSTSLPIELTTFETRTNACDVSLYWETATEQNFGYYQIEASRDGRNFAAVAQQKPESPNSLETRRYKYAVPAKYEDHYFRLKAVDLDGSFEYSPLVFAKAPCARDKYSMSLYPNPNFTSRLTVEVNSATAAEQVQLHILNAQGQIIQLQKVDIAIGSNLVQVDTEELASGTYYVRIIGIEQLSEPLKFVRSNF